MTQDSLATETAKTPQSPRKQYRKPAMIALTVLLLLVALIYLFYYLIWGQFSVYTDDAYVNGNLVQLMSQVSGTVTQIYTDNTFFVEKNQVLIKLDLSDASIALQRSKANLAQTVRKVRQYYDNTTQAEATVIARRADLTKAILDYDRRKALVVGRTVSSEELQHYKTSYETAVANLNTALASLRAVYALVQNSDLYHHPEVESAKSDYRFYYLNYVRSTIVAPVSGYVAKRNVQVGQQVSVNTPLLAIIPLDNVWVDANYKESQLNDLRIDQPVILYADAFPDVTYHGKVIGLNAGTGAAFALLPAQNATGNWIKVVQRLPVRIGLDPKELQKNPLMIGLSMKVYVDITNIKGQRLAKTANQKAIYETNVYDNQLAEADKEIQKVLESNSADISLGKMNV